MVNRQVQDHSAGFSRNPSRAVLYVLAYFDLFHYPLTREEISRFLPVQAGEEELTAWLQQLLADGQVYRYSDFYMLQNNPLWVHRRREGNRKAEVMLVRAARIGRFLYRFPYVRGIGISGSLSKNFAGENCDIDFFIITRANRLWIARTLMHLYKKWTFITGRQHDYCMNYYVDEEALLLEDRNIFVAVELKTLLPVAGEEIMPLFFRANPWADQLLPCCPFRQQQKKDPHRLWGKAQVEGLLNNRAGSLLNHILFSITRKRWLRKSKNAKKNIKGVTMGLITGKHFAKSDPGGFQQQVLEQFDQKMFRLTASPEKAGQRVISSARL